MILNMNKEEARGKLESFLRDKVLTFSIRTFEDGEWIAECNEIPAIMTGGMSDDIAEMDKMIRDAVLTAAGVDTDYANEILKFVGYNAKTSNFFSFNKEKLEERKAEYVVH